LRFSRIRFATAKDAIGSGDEFGIDTSARSTRTVVAPFKRYAATQGERIVQPESDPQIYESTHRSRSRVRVGGVENYTAALWTDEVSPARSIAAIFRGFFTRCAVWRVITTFVNEIIVFATH
jgi:hypothetical protein